MKLSSIYAVALSTITIVTAQTTTGTITADATATPEATDTSAIATTDATLSDTTTLDQTRSDTASTTEFTTSVTEIATTIGSTDSDGGTVLLTTIVSSTIIEAVSSTANSSDSTSTINSTISATASSTTSLTPITLPTSTDAASYLSFAFPSNAPQPTWATGQYYDMLASALYSVDRSFIQRLDYQTIMSAIESAADNAGEEVSASVESAAWGWGLVTTNPWYQNNVATAVQTHVLDYNSAWHSAASSVQALATATTSEVAPAAAAAAPRCTGVYLAGIAAGVAGVVVGAA